MNMPTFMQKIQRKHLITASAVAAAMVLLALVSKGGKDEKASGPQPSLSVTVEAPLSMRLPLKVTANGNIEAWQESMISANVSGLLLAEVKANVGDVVKRGQVLAVFANQTVAADLDQSRARIAEAEATALEAEANAERAQAVADSGALSKQQLQQYSTSAQTARARLNAQIAAAKAQEARFKDTHVTAPDDGIISARNATVGALSGNQELFRLIRQGRLEWRAEVSATQMPMLKPGMPVVVTPTAGLPLKGTVRMLAPTVDTKTRNGLVYVDLPPTATNQGGARAGTFAAGAFEIGMSDSLTLPQSAVMVRDGYSFVFVIGADNKVVQTKVEAGRRNAERIEILTGLSPNAQVVTAGGGFLTDGDTVRVVAAEAADAAGAHDAQDKTSSAKK